MPGPDSEAKFCADSRSAFVKVPKIQQERAPSMSFGAASTAEEVVRGISLAGKVCVVTGSSAGIGVETVRALATAGATVVMAARDAAKNEQIANAIRAATPGARLEPVRLDLSDLAGVREAARAVRAQHPRIDILINNAGMLGGPRTLTQEGAELHFATNHLGPFLFTNLLLPELKAAAPSRIVVLSSNAHRMGGLDFDDLTFVKRPYEHWAAYSQSKMANMLFTTGLAKRLKGSGVTVNAVHPGVIVTEVFRSVPREEQDRVTGWSEQMGSPVKTPAQGAATQVWAATAPELANVSGLYLEDCHIAEDIPASTLSIAGAAPEGRDAARAERLWEVSERLVGETFAA